MIVPTHPLIVGGQLRSGACSSLSRAAPKVRLFRRLERTHNDRATGGTSLAELLGTNVRPPSMPSRHSNRMHLDPTRVQ